VGEVFERARSAAVTIDRFARRNPPIVSAGWLGDTFVAISGLFSVGSSPKGFCTPVLQFAVEIMNELGEGDSDDAESGLVLLDADHPTHIGITYGGPVMCGLAGADVRAFTPSGRVIEEALLLADIAGANRILVSGPFRDVVSEVAYEAGPRVVPGGRRAWLVPASNGLATGPCLSGVGTGLSVGSQGASSCETMGYAPT
jgi:hypothetical protein